MRASARWRSGIVGIGVERALKCIDRLVGATLLQVLAPQRLLHAAGRPMALPEPRVRPLRHLELRRPEPVGVFGVVGRQLRHVAVGVRDT